TVSLQQASATRVPHSFPTRRSSDLHRLYPEPKAFASPTPGGIPSTPGELPAKPAATGCPRQVLNPGGGTCARTAASCCPRHGQRSEEHTSELQSLRHLVCRLLLEKK